YRENLAGGIQWHVAPDPRRAPTRADEVPPERGPERSRSRETRHRRGKVLNRLLVLRERGPEAQVHVATLHRGRVQRGLEALRVQLPAVDDEVRETAGRNRRRLQQQIGDLLVVPGAIDLQAPGEESNTGARF